MNRQLDWQTVASANRINVIGLSGSGKTTLARCLASVKEIPFVEMDQLYWKPNWTEPDDSDFFETLAGALEGPSWVLDGNYSRTRHIKWPRTQVVLLLDLPLRTTLRQIINRSVARAMSKEELWPGTGNTESWRQTLFSAESMIWWVVKNYAKLKKRHATEDFFDGYGDFKVIRIRSTDEVQACLSAVRSMRYK